MPKDKKPQASECFQRFVVYRISRTERREVARYDSQAEAEIDILKMFQKDAMGTLEYTIEKIWTNKRD